jgi:hypothetical protein
MRQDKWFDRWADYMSDRRLLGQALGRGRPLLDELVLLAVGKPDDAKLATAVRETLAGSADSNAERQRWGKGGGDAPSSQAENALEPAQAAAARAEVQAEAALCVLELVAADPDRAPRWLARHEAQFGRLARPLGEAYAERFNAEPPSALRSASGRR